MTDPFRAVAQYLNGIRLRLWIRRARAFLAQGAYMDAALWCEMALELDRSCIAAKELRDAVREAAIRHAAITGGQESSITDELDSALWYIEAERHVEASEHVRRAARLECAAGHAPGSLPQLMLARGQCSYMEGWHTRALRELTAARSPGFEGVEAAYFLALTYLSLGNMPEALRHIQTVIQTHPWLVASRLDDLLEKSASAGKA
jgi:tetratricopeptide (TPR) repeat protein